MTEQDMTLEEAIEIVKPGHLLYPDDYKEALDYIITQARLAQKYKAALEWYRDNAGAGNITARKALEE